MFSIHSIDYSQQPRDIQNIRRLVFQEEQGVPETLEFDGQDATATHLLAVLDGEAVGTLRIRYLDTPSGKMSQAKIERLAVLPPARGQKIGQKLMEYAIEMIQTAHYSSIVIHAQAHLQLFYENLGFILVGEPFTEADILHIKMIKSLS